MALAMAVAYFVAAYFLIARLDDLDRNHGGEIHTVHTEI